MLSIIISVINPSLIDQYFFLFNINRNLYRSEITSDSEESSTERFCYSIILCLVILILSLKTVSSYRAAVVDDGTKHDADRIRIRKQIVKNDEEHMRLFGAHTREYRQMHHEDKCSEFHSIE